VIIIRKSAESGPAFPGTMSWRWEGKKIGGKVVSETRHCHKPFTRGVYVVQISQAPEEKRLTTTASAISAPHRHFSQITPRQVLAHPVVGVGALALSLFCTGILLRIMSELAVVMTGVGVLIGEVGEVGTEDEAPEKMKGARVVVGDSGLPRDCSPMFGKSRSSGAQCSGKASLKRG